MYRVSSSFMLSTSSMIAPLKLGVIILSGLVLYTHCVDLGERSRFG
jgi:hypothetical protein